MLHLCFLFFIFILLKSRKPESGNIQYRAFNDSPKARIETAKVTLPVIFARTLKYGPGELGSNKKEENILYTEEALKDEAFLESVMRSPFSIGTHDKNTDESDMEVGGWPTKAWYDDEKKAVFVDGYVIGKKNVEYVKKNKDKTDFGTSAYLDFVKMSDSSKDGVSAEVDKLRCNHLAILPDIRDENNVIVAVNAATAALNAISKNKEKEAKENMTEEDKEKKEDKENKKDIENEDIERLAKRLSAENSAINERLDKLEKTLKPLTSNSEDDEEDKAEKKKDEEENKEAKNAMPSQDTVSRVSQGLGISFVKHPSFDELASLLGIQEVNFNKTVQAVNARCAEFEKAKSVKNNKEEKETFSDFLASL